MHDYTYLKSFQKHWHLFAAGTLGVLAFVLIYGLEPLRFTGIGWTQHGYDGFDITQHQIGWMFYRNSPWSFPLCKALFLGYPEGTSVAYTDSIPIAALFFKLLDPILPENFQYFGLYTCFCFMMQGVFASALLYLTTGNRTYSVVGSLFFLTSSCFIERCFRHTALSSHWLILAALYLYLLRRRYPQKGIYGWITALLCLSLGIHPYLFAMVLVLLTLSEAESFRTRKHRLLSTISFTACITITIIFGVVIGLFGTEVSSADGFGTYSLNLNAVFNPNSIYHDQWSLFLSPREIFTPQGDGIYYLGLSMLCLFWISTAFFLFFRPKFFIQGLKSCKWLALLLIFFTILAVSNVITFDKQILCIIPLPDWLLDKLNTFRSSARLFFVPYYCIILYALYGLYQFTKKNHFPVILICMIAATLQIMEITPGLKDMHRFFETRYDYIALSSDWEDLANQYTTAKTFDCLTNRSLAFWMAKAGIRTNMMITAPIHMNAYWERTAPERERLQKGLAKGSEVLDPDTIYIISTETGTNRSFANENDLETYIDLVKTAYRSKAELLYLTDWVRDYWVLCPHK